MIELGLEGFDKLVDKYHDKAYDTATDRRGRIWRKVNVPGQKKSVYQEQNPRRGEDAEIFDPAKDQMPRGFKANKDQDSDWDRERAMDPRNRRDTITQDEYDHDHDRNRNYEHRGRNRGGFDHREPAYIPDDEYYDDESPRKPYPNEMPRDNAYRSHPPAPYQQQAYYPPPPNQGYGNYAPPQGARFAEGAAGGALLANSHPPRGYSTSPNPSRSFHDYDYDAENRLGRQRSSPYDAAGVHDDFSPPRRRRTKSVDPRESSRRKSRTSMTKQGGKDFSIGASLAGAVAGGLLGRQLGKGDFLSTTAGAVVGAIGGDIAAGEKKDKKKERDREKEGRRSRRGSRQYEGRY